jgi:hypothetical protein
MKTTSNTTYALIVQSEETERNLFETVAYGVCVLSSIVAISQFLLQSISFAF